MKPLSPQFRPYGWALSTAAIAARAGARTEDVLRFDGNTPPDPPPTASTETVAAALERVQSYRHGGFPELLRAIADYNGVEPENVVLGPGALRTVDGHMGLGDFSVAFFFSVHTLTTVGYGDVYPLGMPANVLAAIEAGLGLMGFALATGSPRG